MREASEANRYNQARRESFLIYMLLLFDFITAFHLWFSDSMFVEACDWNKTNKHGPMVHGGACWEGSMHAQIVTICSWHGVVVVH